MEPDEFETDIGHTAPLSNDSIPDVNQSHYCHSCETPFTGVYCTACGQKNDDYRRSLFSLAKEFIGSITAIESRIWRTWAALLFKPGKVAREYANGRRTHWSSPVRVYIAMSILLFGFLNITQTQLISIDINVEPAPGVTKPLEELSSEEIRLVPSLLFFETKAEINRRNKSRNFDLIARRFNAENGINLGTGSEDLLEGEDWTPSQPNETSNITREPAVTPQGTPHTLGNEKGLGATSSPEESSRAITFSNIDGQVYELENWSAFLFELIKNPDRLNSAFFKYLPRIMFIMMPFTMLIGAIFIRGRGNAILYDHLVHAAYIHAVAFFLILLGILLSFVFPGSAVSQLIFVALLVYLPLSLKRMFDRSWRKTIWTSYGVGFIYAFNMIIIMIGLLGIQVLTTAADIGTLVSP